jgi:hypothetical protein
MVQLTRSLSVWLAKFHPDLLVLIKFGHTELFTDELQQAYIDWCDTEEGRSYLQGGANYEQQ